jgi:hypothetical protein
MSDQGRQLVLMRGVVVLPDLLIFRAFQLSKN